MRIIRYPILIATSAMLFVMWQMTTVFVRNIQIFTFQVENKTT